MKVAVTVALQLLFEHRQLIQTHAERTYPEECCGLLLGQLDAQSGRKTLVEVWPTENVWTPQIEAEAGLTIQASAHSALTRERRFWIAPAVLLQAQREGRDRNLDIIGFYHSHPDHPATPSETDRRYAWPQYSYIIVAVLQGKARDLRSWKLDDDDCFQPEMIRAIASTASS